MSTDTDKHVALYEILVDGAEIDVELSRTIREIRVVDYLQLPDLCTFTVGFKSADREAPPPIDDHPFKIGSRLEVRLGARDKLEVKKVFEGEIVTLEPQFAAGGVDMTVRAFDRSHRLNRARKIRAWQNQTASDIVTSIVSEAGLSCSTDPSGDPFPHMQQSNETDLDFIWRLAHRIGFEFRVQGSEGHFVKAGSDETIELEWPTQVFSFRPRLTGIQQVSEVSVRAYDPKTADVFTSVANEPQQTAEIGVTRNEIKNAFSTEDVFQIVSEPAHSADAAKQLAQALLDRLANAYVSGDGTGVGDPRLRAGTTVKITGIGELFSGTYRVQSSNHVLSGGSTYTTDFSSTAIQTISGVVAAGKPADFGEQLVVGVVTNNDDPDGLGRVRVSFPVLGDDVEGWWARVVTPSAGNDRGLMMLPVVDEEVLVGFEHGDVTRPYVIGSVFNGKQQPGDELTIDKDGSFVMKSDHKMIMRSKEDFKVSSDGALTLDIKGDANLTFKGKLTENITSDYTFKASSNVKGEASINLELKAGAQLTIKGAQIAIESSGPLSLKGAMVDINGSSMVNISGGMINLG